MIELEAQRLCKSTRASCDLYGGRLVVQATESTHRFKTLEGLRRAQQDRGRSAGFVANDVDAGMDSIASIRVEASRWSKHRLIARRWATMGVGRGVASVAQIGLDFDQANDESLTGFQPMNEAASDQLACDGTTVTCIECLA
jgi:hypothetical protein